MRPPPSGGSRVLRLADVPAQPLPPPRPRTGPWRLGRLGRPPVALDADRAVSRSSYFERFSREQIRAFLFDDLRRNPMESRCGGSATRGHGSCSPRLRHYLVEGSWLTLHYDDLCGRHFFGNPMRLEGAERDSGGPLVADSTGPFGIRHRSANRRADQLSTQLCLALRSSLSFSGRRPPGPARLAPGERTSAGEQVGRR